MNKLMIGLSFAAAAQLALASGLWWQQQQQPEPTALLRLDSKQLTEISLEHQGKSLQLLKKDGIWRLPALQNEPARSAKVEALLSALDSSRLHWPVADSSASQTRFEVAEDKFQWKLSLKAGEQSQQIYLGQSPAFKQLYLRRDNEAEIYQQGISTLDWSTDAEQWFDKSLLQLSQINSIRLQDLQLKKESGRWQFSAPNTQGQLQPADTDVANKLQNLFSSLQVTGPAKSSVLLLSPESEQHQLEIEVQSLAGNYNYQLKKQQQHYLLKRHDKDGWYPVAAEQAKLLFELKPEQLMAKQSEKADGEAVDTAVKPQANTSE